MNCPKCGSKNRSGVKYCAHCGAPVRPVSKNNSKHKWLAPLVACAAIALIVVAVWLVMGHSESVTIDGADSITHNCAQGVGGIATAGVKAVEWSVQHEGDSEPFASGVSEVTDGRWHSDWLLLRPGVNTVAAAPVGKLPTTATITYESSTLKPIDEDHLSIDEASNICYVNEYLLMAFSNNVNEEQAEEIISEIGGTPLGCLWGMGLWQVSFPELGGMSLADMQAFASALEAREDVVLCMADTLTIGESSDPNDPWIDKKGNGPNGWDENNPLGTNWGIEAVHGKSAREYVKQRKSHAVTVGVADAYFDDDHEDLNYDFVNQSRRDANRASYLLSQGNAALENDKKSSKELLESMDHGMHVAGIIGATWNNGKGIAGVCDCRLLVDSVRASSDSKWCESIVALLESGARVINFSQGITYKDDAAKDMDQFVETRMNSAALASLLMRRSLALRRDAATGKYQNDFVVVQAAGNGVDNGGWGLPVSADLYGYFASVSPEFGGDQEGIPASDVYNRIIVVGMAYEKNGGYVQAANSNGGARVDLCAPGVNILSCITDNKYGVMSGTSMAAPFVSGAAGLMLSVNPSLSGAEVKRIIVQTATTPVDVNTEFGSRSQAFQTPSTLLDVLAAVRIAAGEAQVTDEPASPASPSNPSGEEEVNAKNKEKSTVQEEKPTVQETAGQVESPAASSMPNGVLNSFVVMDGDRIYFPSNPLYLGKSNDTRILSTELDGSKYVEICELQDLVGVRALMGSGGRLSIEGGRYGGLWISTTDGSGLTQIVDGLVSERVIGDSIYYFVDRDGTGGGSWELHSCRMDGSQDTLICSDPSPSPSNDSWTPTIIGLAGSRIFYLISSPHTSNSAPDDWGVCSVEKTGGEPKVHIPQISDSVVLGDRIAIINGGMLYTLPIDGPDDSSGIVVGEGSTIVNATAEYVYLRPAQQGRDGLIRVNLSNGEVVNLPIYTYSMVDIIGDKLYCVLDDGFLMRCDLDGSNQETVFSSGAYQ